MIFITLSKLRNKPTKEVTSEVSKITQALAKEGVKIVAFYWTLGRYDRVVVMEAPDEKAAMKANLMVNDFVSTERMVAIPSEEATKLVE